MGRHGDDGGSSIQQKQQLSELWGRESPRHPSRCYFCLARQSTIIMGIVIIHEYASHRARHWYACLPAQLGQVIDDDDIERDPGLPADHPKAAQEMSQSEGNPSLEPHCGRVPQSDCVLDPGTRGHDIGGRRCFRYRHYSLRSIKLLLLSSAQRPPHASTPAPAKRYAAVTRIV